jgi:hypothetical protein
MKLEQRIDLLKSLGTYCLSSEPAWEAAKRKAHAVNGWFIPEFVEEAVRRIAAGYLQPDLLTAWAKRYVVAAENPHPRTVGVVMAGNIPLVGFHDFLSIFISGHRQLIKPSVRDEVLIRHLVERLTEMDEAIAEKVGFADRLNGCDAYIATGSNNSARYFDYYFGKYPSLIRRNRTSLAIVTGAETAAELEAFADDVCLYFGLGCRNVTQLLVPESYDFLPLLQALRKYDHLAGLTKYKNNYDYQLTLLILNKKYYMTNDSILLTENESPFSPISVLHYRYYRPGEASTLLKGQETDTQCVVGGGYTPFGQAQHPRLEDYADGVDTMEFLQGLQ